MAVNEDNNKSAERILTEESLKSKSESKVEGKQQPTEGANNFSGYSYNDMVAFQVGKLRGYKARESEAEAYKDIATAYEAQTDAIKAKLEELAKDTLKNELTQLSIEQTVNNVKNAGLIKSTLGATLAMTDPNNPFPIYEAILNSQSKEAPTLKQGESPLQEKDFSLDPVKNQQIIAIASNILGTIGGLVTGQAAEGAAAGAEGASQAMDVAKETFENIQKEKQEYDKFLTSYATAANKNQADFASKYLTEVGLNSRKLLDKYVTSWVKRVDSEVKVREQQLNKEKISIDALKTSGKITKEYATLKKNEVDEKVKVNASKAAAYNSLVKDNNNKTLIAYKASLDAIEQARKFMQKNTKMAAGDHKSLAKLDPTVGAFSLHKINRYSSFGFQLGSYLNQSAAESAKFSDDTVGFRALAKKANLPKTKKASSIFNVEGFDPEITTDEFLRQSVTGMLRVGRHMYLSDTMTDKDGKSARIMIKTLKPGKDGRSQTVQAAEKFARVNQFFEKNPNANAKSIMGFLSGNGFVFGKPEGNLTTLVQVDALYKLAGQVEDAIDLRQSDSEKLKSRILTNYAVELGKEEFKAGEREKKANRN